MKIETERLLITEFTMDMAQTVRDNSLDENNRKFVPDEVWETMEEAEETLAFLISQYGAFDGPLVYPIIVKKTQANVGYVQLCPIDGGKWEVGYHVAEKHAGNGYATEAVKAFLPVIAKQAGISEVYGISLSENKASLAVMRKCGFENVFTGIGSYQGVDREIVRNVWRFKEAETTQKTYFAGGCFWCMEKPYHLIEGVISAQSGYCGGTEENPTYAEVKAQQTMHRETVCVEFDETKVTFSELLEVFLGSIDLFDEGGQFIDRGRSYTCAIYYTDAEQQALAAQRISAIEQRLGKKAAVSLEPYLRFWPAEDYHQDYARRNPEAYGKELAESGRLNFTGELEETE